MSLSGLHKFKLFAAHRSLEESGGGSPTKSPVFGLRRRKTLRMLFDKSSDSRRRNLREILEEPDGNSVKKKRGGNHRGGRRKLKELMGTSPSPPYNSRKEMEEDSREERCEILPVSVTSNGDDRDLTGRRFGYPGSVQSFRLKILRKPWRPVLLSIPEH